MQASWPSMRLLIIIFRTIKLEMIFRAPLLMCIKVSWCLFCLHLGCQQSAKCLLEKNTQGIHILFTQFRSPWISWNLIHYSWKIVKIIIYMWVWFLFFFFQNRQFCLLSSAGVLNNTFGKVHLMVKGFIVGRKRTVICGIEVVSQSLDC